MEKVRKITLFIVAVAVGAAVLFPFYWMIVSSFRSNADIFTTNVNLLPKSLALGNYSELFEQTNFLRWIFNTSVVAFGTLFLGLLFSTFAGFAFAKYRFRGRTVLFLLIFIMVSVPHFVTIIPIFRLLSGLGLTNTYFSLILPFAVNPFAVFLMRQYITNLPEDLLDGARIDGLNELEVVVRIVLPVVKPAIGAAGVFILMLTWNDYLMPLIMMNKESMMLFTVGLASLKTLYVVQYGMIMAGSFLSTLPIIVVFLLLQKQFVAGLTEGVGR